MGNICSRLCPKRRKNANNSYDVHEETFEMQENIDSMNIDDHSPTISKSSNLNDDTQHEQKQSTEALISKTKQSDEEKYKKQEKKFIETKILTQNLPKQISEETVSFTIEADEIHSSKNTQNNQPFISERLNDSETLPITQVPKPVEIEPVKQEVKKPNPNILKPKTIKKKYNPDDYRFKDEVGQFRVKKIDSIKCQQYNIDNCKQSEYFIFDVTANVYIDDTNDCKIYIAPCESTIFVRNCKNLTIVAATKQFRTYECHNCVFSLLCKSQPVIESSSQLTFVPFEIDYYTEFVKQMNTVKLDVWNNHWSEIHNFTKKQGEVHHVLKRHLEEGQSLNWQKGFEEGEIERSENILVPFIQGQYPLEWENYEKCMILFNKDVSKDDDAIIELIQNYRILKGFKGKLAGFGKDDRVALLLGYTQGLTNQEKLQESGQLFTSEEQVQKYESQFFVSFGDQREK